MTPPVQVLLVEDNPADIMLVREALSQHGLEFALREITDAEEAMAYIDRMHSMADTLCPDVVLLDLNVPRGDGLELFEALRASTKCPDVPIIIMSSSDLPHDRAKAATKGTTLYFKKPIELDEFLKLGRLVHEVLTTPEWAVDRLNPDL